ncbi:integrase, partial [Shimia sp. R11_0]|nr:integrase [Shimia sp. R11_0]
HRKAFEYQALKAGMSNLHGLRHGYAQWRYKALTGRPCPKAGGKATKALTEAERRTDRDARMTIAEELGHGRIDVTKAYLG